jgi:ribonuclease R
LVKNHLGEVLPGTIAGVTEFGLFIDLDGFYVQGLLHISDLGADYFRYDPRGQCLIGDRSGRRFTLGEALEVRIANVEPPQGKIELQLLPVGGRKPGKAKSSKHKAGKSKTVEPKTVKPNKGKAGADSARAEKTRGAQARGDLQSGETRGKGRQQAVKESAKQARGAKTSSKKQKSAGAKASSSATTNSVWEKASQATEKKKTKKQKKQTTPKAVKRRKRNDNG